RASDRPAWRGLHRSVAWPRQRLGPGSAWAWSLALSWLSCFNAFALQVGVVHSSCELGRRIALRTAPGGQLGPVRAPLGPAEAAIRRASVSSVAALSFATQYCSVCTLPPTASATAR